MKVSINSIDKVIAIDGDGIQFEDWSVTEVPPFIAAVQIDGDIGHIQWVGNYPHLPINYAQFKAMFYHAMAMHENIKNKQIEENLEARREQAKIEAERIAAEQKRQIEFKELQDIVAKLEKREEL